MLRTDAQHDASGLDILFGKARLLFIAEDDMGVLQLNGILAIGIALPLGVKGIHARHTDEACHKQIGGVIEDFLRGAHLLDLRHPA